jgi:hypothetical protein
MNGLRHIAELNIGRLRYPADDPRLADFMNNDTPHFVMWWVPAGYRPSLTEAKERLAHLTANGPSDHAFGWESVPAAQLWKTARCGAPDEQAA